MSSDGQPESGIIGAVAERGSDILMVPAEGGPAGGSWLRVTGPPPLEVEQGREGLYVLDERGEASARHHIYVHVPYRL
jgi:hypothetical protein